MDIKHLRHDEIEKSRWDATLSAAPNAVLYANSWYLDAISPDWEALVAGAYEYIMPLPVKNIVGYRFVFQPLFVQRLGLFSIQPLNEEILGCFLTELTRLFDVVDYSLSLCQSTIPSAFHIRKRSNFVLDISGDYASLAVNYSQDAKKSLRKYSGIEFVITDNHAQTIANFVAAYGEATRAKANNYERFEQVVQVAASQNKLIGAAVLHQSKVLASALFFIHNKRVYYVLGAPTPEGKKMNATHFLIDGFIREYAGKFDILDFEGSDIPSVAYFYKKWGSTDEGYLRISYRKNRLIALALTLKAYLRDKMSR